MRPDRQLGLLWGGSALLLIAVSPTAPRWAAALPACPIKAVTGLPCLSCGATRAALALARLDLATAMSWNPLAAIGWAALLLGGLVAGALALANRPLPSWPRDLSWSARLGVCGTLLANWLYLYARGV